MPCKKRKSRKNSTKAWFPAEVSTEDMVPTCPNLNGYGRMYFISAIGGTRYFISAQ
jgi:hypothetical protein